MHYYRLSTILPHSTDTLPHFSPDPASNLPEQQIAYTFLTDRLLISKTLYILILITEGQYILLVLWLQTAPSVYFKSAKNFNHSLKPKLIIFISRKYSLNTNLILSRHTINAHSIVFTWFPSYWGVVKATRLY